MYEDLGLVSTHIFLSWCSGEGIGVSNKLILANIITLGWFLQVLLSWSSIEEISVFSRLVPTSSLVGAQLRRLVSLVGWFLQNL
jgi:hypothetical protein